AVVVFLGATLASGDAAAHGMRTAYVELREDADSRVHVQVRTGAAYGRVRVVMPDDCTQEGATDTWSCRRPLRGSTVRIEGLGGTVGDAVVVAVLRDGSSPSALTRPGAASWTIPDRTGLGDGLVRYARAGFFHVLAGADHLLFLAVLVVALRRFRAVVVAETAFTLSHSLSFTASALGLIHVPTAAAEAAIALSLILVALDAGRRPMTPHAGARAALVFGAVHGLGFAGGLQELGVPREAATSALIGFAAGVELAQVVFLLGCFAVMAIVTRLSLRRRATLATAYAVGATGFLWLLERALPIVQRAIF
ncbi:MAG TPA: HupE/UreJ family protein, partial [Labilithrix sp.]|nr:HupE/UreJ family protein [Labilithrix sp.]